MRVRAPRLAVRGGALVAALLGAATVAGLGHPSTAAAATCTGHRATHLTWTRRIGHLAGTLRWQRPAIHPTRYTFRVTRNRRVVGQPGRTSIRIRVRPGHTYTFTVRVVSSTGHVSSCAATLRKRVAFHTPTAPTPVTVKQRTADSITIHWPESVGDAGVVGYRVYRDGAVVTQTQQRTYTLTNLAASTTYQLAVRGVDGRGNTGRSSSPIEVTTIAPAPSTGKVHAFLLASTTASFTDFQNHYQQIGVVYPTYYDCLADTSIVGHDVPLITSWAKVRQIEVLPRVNCQSASALHTILTDATVRSRTLSHLENLVTQNGYDGLNIDFESGDAADRDALTSFVQTLATWMQGHGKKLSVCVSATYYNQTTGRAGFYDYKALGQAADYVFVMAWGYHWSTSAPGSIDDIGWETNVANYVASMPNTNRYILGQGLYGMDWPSGGGSQPATALEWLDVMRLESRVGATAVFDQASGSPHFSYTSSGVSHDVWYENQYSLGLRVTLAVDRHLGVGFWHLGSEDPALWANPLLG